MTMKGGWSLLGLLVVTCLSVIDGKGIDLGLCSNENVVCGCGKSGLQIQVPIKRCTFFYRWKPYCKACDAYDKDALCSGFQNCLSCDAVRDGGCTDCPFGRYGKNCQGVCQCQNGGKCHTQTGKCECSNGFSGSRCEQSKQSTCGPPPSLRHGTISGASQGPAQEGTIAQYRCASGYALVGPSQKRCEKPGIWSGGETRCEYTCDVPKSQPSMKIMVDNYATMATADNPTGVKLVRRVKFECNSGYVLKGLPELNCLPTSQWNGKVPTCELSSSCTKPVFNGDIRPTSASYSVGSRVTLSCTSGFILVGSTSLTCQQNGKWNAAVPNCVRKTTTPASVMCSPLRAPDNGKLTAAPGDSSVGTKVQFTCDVGFNLAGSSERECLSDGTWSGTQPRCIKVVTCADPGTPKNGGRVVKDVTARINRRGRGPGSRSRFRGRSRMSPRMTSMPDGQFAANTAITFSCKSAVYNLVGSATRTCQASGQWDGLQPKCEPVCGKSDGARAGVIVNGQVSKTGEYPWQVMVAHQQQEGSFLGVCGGTLISEEWIVTAGHCVTSVESTDILPLTTFKIYLGKYFRDDSKDDNMVQEFTVSEIKVNPNYDPLLLDSDVALIRLSRPAELTKRVMPICLADNSAKGQVSLEELIQSGSFITVSGWGETENGTDADVLQTTRLMAITNTECENKYAQTNIPLVVTSNMFCAGHDDGRSDTCFGDSGGPAVAFVGGGKDRLWYLVGVVSWGSPLDCGVPMQYSGFTRVSSFLGYLYQNAGL